MPSTSDPQSIIVGLARWIDRAADFAIRRFKLADEDAEEFRSRVMMKLIADDYAVIRDHRGASKMETYLSTVIHRFALDFVRERKGRWRPSAEAERQGALAVELEMLVRRDRNSLAEAGEMLRTRGRTTLSYTELARLLAKLPEREPLRPTTVGSGFELDGVRGNDRADERVRESEAGEDDARRRAALGRAMAQLDPQDRIILRMRFQDGASVADIARALNLDQKPLYRRIERLTVLARKLVEDEGISREEVRAILDAEETE